MVGARACAPGQTLSDASGRGSAPHLLYGFLTTEANAVVKGDAGYPDDRRGARCMGARRGRRRGRYNRYWMMRSRS